MKTFSFFLLLFSAIPFLAAAESGHEHGAIYQCPMHPWIKSDQPAARCTICGMALVAAARANPSSDSADPHLVTLTAGQAAVTGVKTAPVITGPLVRSLHVNGVIDDDETRHRILAARVPGRIEKLHVNYVGAEVTQGEPLATIYSPEMLTAQRTYVERIRAGTSAFTASERSAAHERLLELGLTPEEIRILEGTLQPTAMVNVRAPMSGTVVSRDVYEGQYVGTSDRLFEIGDFSRMWFVFDIYESDLAWIRPGQEVEIALASLPGERLTAPITFVDPNLNETTRTARARVVLDNQGRKLLHRQTALARVITTAPSTVQVPRSAVLQHRGTPIVYVERGDRSYAATAVQLGRVGDSAVEVLSGLQPGEHVVVEGGLILDGQAQLTHAAIGGGAHGSGPTPPRTVSAAEPRHGKEAYALLRTLAFAAADAATSLAADDLPGYQERVPALRAALKDYLSGHAAAARGPLAAFRDSLVEGPDLDAVRRAFEPVSTAIVDLARAEQMPRREGLHAFECPMTPVLGNGRWLSRAAELRNPFFGSTMLECGDELDVRPAPANQSGFKAFPSGHPPLGVAQYLLAMGRAARAPKDSGDCCGGHVLASARTGTSTGAKP